MLDDTGTAFCDVTITKPLSCDLALRYHLWIVNSTVPEKPQGFRNLSISGWSSHGTVTENLRVRTSMSMLVDPLQLLHHRCYQLHQFLGRLVPAELVHPRQDPETAQTQENRCQHLGKCSPVVLPRRHCWLSPLLDPKPLVFVAETPRPRDPASNYEL